MRASWRAVILWVVTLALAGCASTAAGGAVSARRTVSELPGQVPATTRTAPARKLTRIITAMVSVPRQTFGVAVASGGRFVFVSRAGSVAVLRGGPPTPVLVRSIAVPDGQGETLTPDGRYVLVASRTGAAVISVARAEDGNPHPVTGVLTSPLPHSSRERSRCASRLARTAEVCQGSAIEAAVSPYGRFAFVSIEYSGEVAVFDLARALRAGFSAADFVGAIPVSSPVGLAISPDGRWLYASELEQPQPGVPASAVLHRPGTLSMISVPRAEQDPARSVVAAVAAGFSPVRVILSANGTVAWVTARASDALLGFATARLGSDPDRSLVTDVRVGEAPVGLALVANGTRIMVADSNRFAAAGAAASLYVVSVPAALARRRAVLGAIRAGSFPREMVLEPGSSTLLVTNYVSGQLETVDLTHLP